MKNPQRTSAWGRLAVAPLLFCAWAMAGCAEGDGSDLEPWPGTLVEGLAAMEAFAAEQKFDDALAVADRLDHTGGLAELRGRMAEITGGASEDLLAPLDRSLSALGLPALNAPQRGEVQFARALALLGSVASVEASTAGGDDGAEAREDAAGRMERAILAFGRARAAGGEVSLDAVYDLGTLDLQLAESIRATIPEVSGGPPPPPPSGKDAASGGEEPDPLDLARAAYLAAREDLIERLRMGEGDDARANVELALRRLRELDEIQRQREDQQDQQDDGETSDDPQENEGSEDEEQDPSDSEKEPEEQDGDQESESDQPSEEEQEEEPEDEPEEGEQPEPELEEDPDEEQEGEQGEPEEEPEGEELMTAEELSRILDRNREHQEKGEGLRRKLRIGRKEPARRDW
ncbi:MAG: hypothetical protein P8R46_07525 [Planctomycetota bacterium]|nr:hypothetical protein [Planctomycetota bacterium]